MNILILNGPNLNLLGLREPDVYGTRSYQDLYDYCKAFELTYPVQVDILQSNHEGELIDILHQSLAQYDGVIFNPGALTHYSYALFDAIQSIPVPVVEVHLSDLTTREPFRQISVIREACIGHVMGLGFESYEEGLKLLLESRDPL